ncbi:MAG: hypothetical protein ACLTN0_06025 [Coprococcus phoceensis]
MSIFLIKPGAVNKNSASFIDPVIVQAKDGTIFLMADAFPYTELVQDRAKKAPE